ncbi:MAG: monovalent cation/H(+) antiporter subunit G [Oscillospiraceae bacterium]|nr:monovalent cation/H(+) antiporter subunit G [Oscillospiraceae bacterium]
MSILAYIVMGIGVAFMLLGVIGIFKPGKDFYYRILVACKIDTVGLLTLGIGLAIYHGISFFTGKMFLIVIMILVLNPFVAHIVARSASRSGYDSIGDSTDVDESAGEK